jgi:hypothetical protein
MNGFWTLALWLIRWVRIWFRLPIHPDHLPDPSVDPRNGFLLRRPREPVGAPETGHPYLRGEKFRFQGSKPPAGKSGPKRILLPDPDRNQEQTGAPGRVKCCRDGAGPADFDNSTSIPIHQANRQSPRASADDERISTRFGRHDPAICACRKGQYIPHNPLVGRWLRAKKKLLRLGSHCRSHQPSVRRAVRGELHRLCVETSVSRIPRKTQRPS